MKDIQVKKLIDAEKKRQKKVINLTASENYVSKDVLQALGSEFTNKYAEGYAGARYYYGCENTDKLEELCKERALALFGLSKEEWHVNVQPLSGSPANLAIYMALLGNENKDAANKPAEASASGNTVFQDSDSRGKIMGMALAHGGHLTHGQKVSASGKLWQQISYGVDQTTEMLNYDQLREQAIKEKPALIVAGYTAYSRIVDWQRMREVADAAESYLMVDMSHFAGLVAGGAYPSPFPYADVVMTTTHKTLRGPRAAIIFVRKDSRELYKKIDKAVFPGLQGGPHLNQIAAVAVALKEAAALSFKKYAENVVKNSRAMCEELKALGWRIVSDGTDTHLFLVDTWMNGTKNEKGAGGISGKEASQRLEAASIIVNKNAIPFDTRTPADPSGIRLGSAPETTRGKKVKDFIKFAKIIDKILRQK